MFLVILIVTDLRNFSWDRSNTFFKGRFIKQVSCFVYVGVDQAGK